MMPMSNPLHVFYQVVCYTVFAVLIGYFSTNPAYQHHDSGLAVIKLSFSHAGEHIQECVPFAPEVNLNKSPNMIVPMNCPRGRVPLLVEVVLDEKILYREELSPSRLFGDGEASVYHKFTVTPGKHTLTARLRDSRREEGFDHEHSEDIELSAQQNFVIDFTLSRGGFDFL